MVMNCAVCASVFTFLTCSMISMAAEPAKSAPTGLRFAVRLGPTGGNGDGQTGPGREPRSGRLLVVLGRRGGDEPRLSIGQTGKDAPPVLGRDVVSLAPGGLTVLDGRSALFPIDQLSQLRPDTYAVQALLHVNPDLNIPNAPGDLYSAVTTVRLDPAAGGTVELELSHQVPDEKLPPDSELVKYLKIHSRLLSDFHGRPMNLRAGIILPREFARQPDRRYPVWVHIGGYASRFTIVGAMMSTGTDFHSAWMAKDAPPMILIHLDGAGPLGDPYQVDSANHGPFGAAITRELIPLIEERFRGIGQGHARVVDGGSTGGWVALALQVFYPDFFNGAWSFCPDSVDFRSFELVNIYQDDNAYVGPHGFERPAARDVSGEVRYTMRHECQLENVLGRGGSWTLSGGQWGAWNATYGPRGPDGRPVPLWDPVTGAIDHKVASHWKTYDLRSVLESRWAELGPKLKGKLHIWVGDADDYFLNNAVHRLDDFLRGAQPPFEGTITFSPRQGHCWIPVSDSAIMKQMAERMASPPPASTVPPVSKD
jgi:S-formylglutathione hydrolase FrmB